ncbi:FHF complex subunit HOOK interacting protein 2A-like [Vanessa tameamea]|uniref:FHF complex subunit HOOK interacting protein 2A-like n=1 Tax=Vanessa tameamea TaxID=334116 RepID=A0A8B8IU86_VANTA
MLSRFSDVLQTAADVLAPPATRLEDFEYHWKMVVNFYQNYEESSKVHFEDTRVPHHLHQMLQLIVDEEKEQQGGTVGPCLEAVIQRSVGVLDALSLLVSVDRPPGARYSALTLATSLLRRTRSPCLNSPHVYRPLQRMLLICNESPASPTEKEEVELLLTLCGLVRKEPGLANIFTTPFVEDTASLMMIPEDIKTLIPIKSKAQTPKKNPLFEVDMAPNPLKTVSIVRVNKDDNYVQSSSSAGDDNVSSKSHKTVYDDNDKFLLIDLLLSYLDSADNQVVLRACEGVLIVSSLAEDDIAALVTGCSPACERLAARLQRRYRALPPDLDPAAVDQLSITWAYVAQDFGDKNYNNFYGYRELTAFFSWLDYIDTLMKECHPIIACHLSRAFRTQFLEPAAEELAEPRSAILATAVLAKCLRVLDSQDLVNEFSSWLAGEGEGGAGEWGPLRALALRCLRGDHDLTLETLRFFEAVIEKGTEHSIDRLVLSRVCARAYRAAGPALQDERERLNDLSLARERERARESLATDERAGGLLAHADDNIHRVVNSFLLLLPRGVQSQPLADCEHYVHDAQRHYQLWLDITSTYNWPTEVTCADTASSTHSYDSRPEADLHLDDAFAPVHAHCEPKPSRGACGGAGGCAFTQALVLRSRDAPTTSEEEFDAGPFLKMLFKLLSTMPDQPYQVNLHLTSIISKLALLPHPNLHEYLLNPDLPTAKTTPTLFKTLQEVARRLTMEVPRIKNYKKVIENTRLQLMSEDPSYDEIGSHNQLVESLIVLEEFCKELAAIAFVKHQHQLQQQPHQHQR